MKKMNNLTFASLLLASAFSLLLSACVKDSSTRTYSIYTPVYKSKTAVYAGINTSSPRAIKSAGKIYVKGNYIFLNELDKGIHVIDNSTPSSPKNIGFIPIPGNRDLAVKGNTLYADLYTDLVTIDITDPAQAKVKKVLKNSFPFRLYAGGFMGDSSRIIVDWLKKDTTVSDIDHSGQIPWNCITCSVVQFASLEAAPKAYSPSGTGGSMARFTIAGSMLYTVSNSDLNAFSISAPEDPVFSKQIPLPWGIETIFPFRDKLFIGSTTGMFIFDISNPSTPTLTGQFSHLRRCDPVIADDKYAFVTLRSGTTCGASDVNQLDVLDISNLSSPLWVKSYTLTNPHGLSKDGHLLFICDGSDGLKIYDAASVESLKLIKHIKGFETFDVIAMNNLAIVVEKSGIRQFDYSNPADIKLLSTINWNN